MRGLHDFLVYVNPEPHRRTFLKPFVRNQTADFCSTCHKVHLDTDVNNYRWVRGFNDYDNWQASGVSGSGRAVILLSAEIPELCGLPHAVVDSHDAGNVNGKIHSHRFPAANTALPTVQQRSKADGHGREVSSKQHPERSHFRVVAGSRMKTSEVLPSSGAQLSTTFAVGEEGDFGAVAGDVELAPLTGPLDRVNAVVRPGETYRVDVVVRTRKIGHFFPGGTVDAFDVWLELQATDDNGRVIFWSGKVEDGGKGPVEKGAHFYRSLQLDGNGNPINKRNAWATRSLAYVRLIPPGAADTVHYRMTIPNRCPWPHQSESAAALPEVCVVEYAICIRGERAPGTPAATKDYDNGIMGIHRRLTKVSGRLNQFPTYRSSRWPRTARR